LARTARPGLFHARVAVDSAPVAS